ncbi:MAG: hypothetical protein PV344_04215 [Anaplasma sp.]|nr:hypothetical protein [Anaplasma sp.]
MGSNFRESNVVSVELTNCPNGLRDLFFANRRQFAKFVKIRSSRKFSRLQYMDCHHERWVMPQFDKGFVVMSRCVTEILVAH